MYWCAVSSPSSSFQNRAENTLLYQPLDIQGAPIKQFDPGQHTITARFWKLDEGEDTAHQYTWTFRAA